MNWDLAAYLVILVAVSTVIWLYDVLLLAPKRKAALARLSENASERDYQDVGQIPFFVDLARSLLPVFIIVLVLRSFLVEPFRIPSGSMMPTLLVGDFILVNKYTYGIRLPVLNWKILNINEPRRGDVVVFRYPENPTIPYIKRVVGVPGDKIEYHHINKMLYVNGEPILQVPLGAYIGMGSSADMTQQKAEELTEHLFDKKHSILIIPEKRTPIPQTISSWNIEKNQYFVLGDNRDNSLDSRFWGIVPEENLIGKAFFIWMSWDTKLPNCQLFSPTSCINWGRIGNSLD
ncbi:signal peptidase I [Beggiatoa leptomitoformis]|uniref:Signal peptidase I n=1 Tax=Beggiatoa leptomitoformis TaxID=288004 RepID=A0A2N9YC02_9GAMM|nr:signal peptidase I [Beggiatoa leptomitoformis]ALG66677.1 signal peptidase I [Beggiatoa leptomitoformis]AUI67998.1 signal peptidase I [Beggiatoa leptomitoformis]